MLLGSLDSTPPPKCFRALSLYVRQRFLTKPDLDPTEPGWSGPDRLNWLKLAGKSRLLLVIVPMELTNSPIGLDPRKRNPNRTRFCVSTAAFWLNSAHARAEASQPEPMGLNKAGGAI